MSRDKYLTFNYMKSIFKIFTFVLISTFILTSCSTRLVDFTVISSKNHSLNFDISQGKQVKGTSNGFFGLGASIKDAMDNALQSAGPDYDILINGVVRYNDYIFVAGYTVTGTAVSSSKLKALLGIDGFEEWCLKHNVFDPSEAIVQN